LGSCDKACQDFVCPGDTAYNLEALLLMPVLDVQGHNLSSFQISFPFVNSYLDQGFSGFIQNKADVFTHCVRDKVLSE
jgi:hypothetical protein